MAEESKKQVTDRIDRSDSLNLLDKRESQESKQNEV